MRIDLNKIKKIHFIGIGGIGLSAIAQMMKEKGKEVSGSDLSPSLVVDKLKKLGVKIYNSQIKENISDDIDLAIYTTAVPKNNPELKKAKELGIKTINYPEALGIIFNDKFGVAVCGTHGKSTVSAMVGILLDDAKLDPSVIVGSLVPQFNNGNLRMGKNKYFVAEACEYERAFLNLYPKIIILNNIEFDHTDYYQNLDDVKSAFKEFVSHLPKDGILIVNGDSLEISNIKVQISSEYQISNIKFLNFGLGEKNDLRSYDIRFESGMTKFKVVYNNKDLGEFVLKVPGLFNVYNALAVISLGLVLNIPIKVIKKSLINFFGIWRRFEIKGKYKNALVISDYAHHPTAVKATIEAAREFYPNRKIFAVFQPHQHNRTKKLYQDFLKSFNGADVLILSEIFDVAGREKRGDQSVSSLDLAKDIKQRRHFGMSSSKIFYAKNLKETKELINANIKSNDILLIMGAGDIYKIADDLTK